MKVLISAKNFPIKAHNDDACADLIATSVTIDGNYIEYGTDIRMLPPEGHFGLIFPRSSISNYDLVQANSVGVIDNYTGEWKIRFKRLRKPLIDALYREFSRKQDQYVKLNMFLDNLTLKFLRFELKRDIKTLKNQLIDIDEQIRDIESFEKLYQKGDKIAQICFIPKTSWEYSLVDKLPETIRGEGGFGSTDLKSVPKSMKNNKKDEEKKR